MVIEDPEKALIIFVKNPVLGKVKTRLARSVGDDEALRIYKLLLSHTQKIALGASCSRYVYFADSIGNGIWSTEYFKKRIQDSGDLGAKMSSAFSDCLNNHSKVVIIGSDCAMLSAEIINDAFDSLVNNDIVIGPTQDGGYYLLGMQSENPQLFENIKWSTPEVYEETIFRIKKSKRSLHILPKLSDVDLLEDWKKYGAPYLS